MREHRIIEITTAFDDDYSVIPDWTSNGEWIEIPCRLGKRPNDVATKSPVRWPSAALRL